VVVKPKLAGQKSEITRNDIKKKIDPTQIPVNNVRMVSNGAVVVQCTSKDDLEECREQIEKEFGENFDITVLDKIKPLLKIVGLSEMMTETDLVRKTKTQNDFIGENAVISVVELKEKRNKIFATVKMDGESFRNTMLNERIIVGWDRCRVYENVNVTRCYNCAGYMHIAKNCTHGVWDSNCSAFQRKVVSQRRRTDYGK
jgi:hypothetical protein